MRLISIDPGVKYFAYAVFEDGVLQDAEKCYVNNVRRFANEHMPRALVCEKPVVYRHIPSNIVVDLAIAAGIVVSSYQLATGAEVVWYTPTQWKGSRPKKDHQRDCILPSLSLDELSLIKIKTSRTRQPKWDKDIVDAVGIGLYHLGRLRKA